MELKRDKKVVPLNAWLRRRDRGRSSRSPRGWWPPLGTPLFCCWGRFCYARVPDRRVSLPFSEACCSEIELQRRRWRRRRRLGHLIEFCSVQKISERGNWSRRSRIAWGKGCLSPKDSQVLGIYTKHSHRGNSNLNAQKFSFQGILFFFFNGDDKKASAHVRSKHV